MTISKTIDPPLVTDTAATFDTKAFAAWGALNTWASQANALAVEVDTDATTATTQAGIATTQAGISTTQAGISTTQAGIATTQATNAASSANTAAGLWGTSTTSLLIATGSKTFTTQTSKQFTAGQWVLAASAADGANYMHGQVTSYSGGTLVLNVTNIGGSGTQADWNLSVSGTQGATGPTGGATTSITGMVKGDGSIFQKATANTDYMTPAGFRTINGTSVVGSGDIAAGASVVRSARTSNTILGAADKGTLIDCTSTFTQTFTAAATLGSGWFCYIRNSGTGNITLDPNASELIDGVASGVMKPGMELLVQCDGTVFNCLRVGPQIAMTLLTSGTSWTAPIGVRNVRIRGVGGGGGGQGGSNLVPNGSGGGGAGGFDVSVTVVPGTAYTYAIGSGGAGGSLYLVPGNTGGNTSITVSGVTYTGNGGSGATGAAITSGGSASGSGAVLINGGGASVVSTTITNSGASMLGCAGVTLSTSTSASTGYGSGGAGGLGSGGGSTDGAGGRAGVIILEY